MIKVRLLYQWTLYRIPEPDQGNKRMKPCPRKHSSVRTLLPWVHSAGEPHLANPHPMEHSIVVLVQRPALSEVVVPMKATDHLTQFHDTRHILLGPRCPAQRWVALPLTAMPLVLRILAKQYSADTGPTDSSLASFGFGIYFESF